MNIIQIQNNKNNIVKKHNDIIQAKGNLSITAQKMLIMLIGMIRKDDSNFQQYAINIEDYKKQIGATNKETSFYLKQALELMRNPFEVKKGVWFNWCSKVDITSLEGHIILKIDNELKPYLLRLQKNFTTYNLTNILNLKSKYSIRIYELLIKEYNKIKEYKPNQKIISFTIKIDKLKEILKLPKSYLYADIKRQVLEKAKKELKDNTDIFFKYEEIKPIRRVEKLKINIFKNNKGSNDYLKDLNTFKNYIREKYKPEPNLGIFPTIYKNKEAKYKYGIDNKGLLYISKPGETRNLTNKEAKKTWENLYNMAIIEGIQF